MIQRHLRFAVLGVLALSLAACSGVGGGLLGNYGGLGGLFGGNQCNPGTQVQLANPVPYQTGVNPGIGQITIVANGNNNTLYSTYQSYNIMLQDTNGTQIQGGPLQLVSDPNGPHPYNSDYYYQSSVGTLQYGTQYTAYLTQNGYCSFALQSFST